MSAVETTATGSPVYWITDAMGNPLSLRMTSATTDQPQTVTIGSSDSGIALRLTRQNVTDLLAPLTGFSTTGALS